MMTVEEMAAAWGEKRLVMWRGLRCKIGLMKSSSWSGTDMFYVELIPQNTTGTMVTIRHEFTTGRRVFKELKHVASEPSK